MFKLVRAVCCAVLTVAAFLIVPPLPAGNAVQTKPNIIVVMVDDMRSDDLDVMPNARQIIGPQNGLGAKYENTVDGLPLCCPARVSFLTGQYSHNNGVATNNEAVGGGWEAWHDGTEQTASLPIWLNSVNNGVNGGGYRTQLFGKYVNEYGVPAKGNSDTFVPNGWDWWMGLVHGAGYYGFDTNEEGTVVQHPNAYLTNWLRDRATAELDQHLDSDVPIFQWISFYAPHDGPNDGNTICNVPAEPQYEGMFNPGVPSGPAFNEADVSDKPAWIQNNALLTQAQRDDIAECRGERRDGLKSVDNAIGEIRDELVQAGELNNTYLVFISDNGYMLGEHRIGAGKQWPYEESAGVPLLIRGPGMPTGTKTRIVSNVDLTASIVGWAGANATLPLDGQPVETVPPANGTHRAVLVERLIQDGPSELPLFSGVRLPPNTSYDQLAYFDYVTGLDELYDGPDQITNRINDPAYDTLEAELQAVTAEMATCSGFNPNPAANTTDCHAVWTE